MALLAQSPTDGVLVEVVDGGQDDRWGKEVAVVVGSFLSEAETEVFRAFPDRELLPSSGLPSELKLVDLFEKWLLDAGQVVREFRF